MPEKTTQTTTHNCSETIKRVVLSLDGYLSESEEVDFLKEVNCCDQCLEKYEIEQSFKQFLVSKISHRKVDPSLIDQIKNKIKSGV